VERAYRREQMLQSILKEQQDAVSPKHKDVETLSPSLKDLNIQPKAFVTGTKTLANFLEGIPDNVNFEPENENEPVLLNSLPNELLLLIVGKMDPTSIERLASVCKKARVLTLDRQIWRYASYLNPRRSFAITSFSKDSCRQDLPPSPNS
jgi:F-box protein 9